MDISRLPSIETSRLGSEGGLDVLPAAYLPLTPVDVQCRAADRSAVANLLQSQSQHQVCQAAGLRQAGNELEAQLLELVAADQRNTSAGAAVTLLYRLAEIELVEQTLIDSLAELDHAMASLRQLRAQGIAPQVDESDLQRQQLQIRDQQLQLQLLRYQLNAQLAELLDYPEAAQTPIWPLVDLSVSVEPLDPAQAVAVGLLQRRDLMALHLLADSLQPSTLPLARSALVSQHWLLGLSPSVPFWWTHLPGLAPADDQLQTMCRQLAELIAQRERSVTREIREAAYTLQTRLEQLALAREAWESFNDRISRLEQQRSVGQASLADVNEARLKRLESQAQLARQLIAWKLALVELKQAQGELGIECGY